jgi:hypothetical protein
MRAQEFYENADPRWRNQHYNINEFINWYKNEFKNHKYFTYGDDWQGFNIPSKILEDCMFNVKEPTDYDKIMLSIIKTIKNRTNDYYLIGDDLDGYALKHEVAHGLFYTNIEYKSEMLNMIHKLNKKIYRKIADDLFKRGYCQKVIDDEIQAYSATSYPNFGANFTFAERIKLDNFNEKMKKIYTNYTKNIGDLYPIKIDFSNYF